MAIKIPEAPNIVGGEEVLRSPDMVSPVRETLKAGMDLDSLQKSIGNITDYYKGMVRDQTNTWMTAGKNEYLQHMTNYANRIYEDYQGKDAQDLYARFIKPESDKWLNNKFGEPKDDGQIRIVDKELQKQFSNWVSTQQPHFISTTANYEQREWDKFRESEFTARDNEAAKLILNATTPETIQNGINAFRENTYEQHPGMSPTYIEQLIAGKIDESVTGHLTQLAATQPYRAWTELNTDPVVANNISEGSKQKVIESIRNSYKNVGINEAAHAEINDGGSRGMVNNMVVLHEIFGDDAAEVQAEMRSKASERAAALRKAQAGQKEAEINMAMNKIRNARTDQAFADGITDLYAVDPDAANAVVAARDSEMAAEQDMETAGLFVSDRISEISEKLNYTDVSAKVDAMAKSGAIDNPEKVKKLLSDKLSKDGVRTTISEVDKRNVIEEMVDQEGEWKRPQIEAAFRIYERAQTRKDQMQEYKELSTRISNGEIRAYDVQLMGHLDPSIQRQLSNQIAINNEYIDTKNDLNNLGISLDKIMHDNGADAQYNNLDVSSKNLLKRNIVYEINAAKVRNGGTMPDADAINGIVVRVQKNSVSPMMAVVQDAARAENLSATDLTDEQRLALGVYESLSWNYNKPDKRGLSEQQSRAEKTINKIAGSSRLSFAEREYIKQNKTYLVSLLQAGDIAGMVDFMALATQGGF